MATERFIGNYVGKDENGEKQFILYDRKTGNFYGQHTEGVCLKLMNKFNEMDEKIRELKEKNK